jgi:probable HAF family extracellular repeat protein
MKTLLNDNLKSQSRLHRLFVGLITIGLIADLAIGVSTVSAKISEYKVTDLGALPARKAPTTVPASINNQGQVTGTSGMIGVDESAFLYHPEQASQTLEDLGRNYSGITHGCAVNAVGDVVGDAMFENPEAVRPMRPVPHAALFHYGKIEDLGTLNGAVYSRATGINASGQVVGFSGTAPDDTITSRAFIWTPGVGMRDIGTLGGASALAFGINDSGFVTGTAQIGESSREPITHAFIYPTLLRYKMLDLGTLGGNNSYGMAINLNNHVAGYSTLEGGIDRIHAFLYDGNKMYDLGSLDSSLAGNDQSYALALNINDEVVGYSYIPAIGSNSSPQYATRQTAFIYLYGMMLNLNDWITPEAAKQFWLRAATGINDNGQVVAVAEDLNTNELHAVLLTH